MTKVTKIKITETEIKTAVAEYKAIGKHFDEIMDLSVDESQPNWEREQKKLERRHFAAERKAKVKFLREFFAKIAPKKTLKIEIGEKYVIGKIRAAEVIYFDLQTAKIKQEQFEKLVSYFEDDDTEVDVDVADNWDVLGEDDADIEIEILKEE